MAAVSSVRVHWERRKSFERVSYTELRFCRHLKIYKVVRKKCNQ